MLNEMVWHSSGRVKRAPAQPTRLKIRQPDQQDSQTQANAWLRDFQGQRERWRLCRRIVKIPFWPRGNFPVRWSKCPN